MNSYKLQVESFQTQVVIHNEYTLSLWWTGGVVDNRSCCRLVICYRYILYLYITNNEYDFCQKCTNIAAAVIERKGKLQALPK